MSDIPKHWVNGGTAITNFTEDRLDLYLDAIEKYGDERLYVHSTPMLPMTKGFSLNYLDHPGKSLNLSDFWEVFDEIKKAPKK